MSDESSGFLEFVGVCAIVLLVFLFGAIVGSRSVKGDVKEGTPMVLSDDEIYRCWMVKK